MKKLLLVGLLFFISIGAFPQKNQSKPVFKEVIEQSKKVLSIKQQSRLQKLKQTDDYLNVTLLKVEDLEKSIKNESLTFNIPGMSKNAIAETKSIDFSTNNDFIWNGTFNNGEAFVIHKNGRTYGHIRNNGSVFDIQYLENDYVVLIEYNMKKLNQINCAYKGEHDEKGSIKLSPYLKSGEGSEEMGAGGGSSPLVRVLVLYTPAAEASGMNISDLANTARGQWITASINSSVISGLEIAGVEPFNFIETPNISDDVANLRNNINAQQLRDQFEADIVLLFTDGSYFSRGIVALIGPSDNDAYGIVQVANATSTITFSHEAAHLFGARHENDPATGDAHGHDWQTGWWPFLNKYGSVMRTSDVGRARVLHFSNPNRTHEGKKTGVSNVSFNSRVINVNGSTVEDFRYTQPSLTTSIYGPSSANDGDALFFSSSTSNGQSPYTYMWKADTGSGYFTVGYASTLNYTMPTDKDLNLKLIVTDSNSNQVTDIYFVRNLFLDGGPCTECPDNTLDALTEDEVKNLNSNQIVLFPNPASNVIKAVLPKKIAENHTKIQIIDLQGIVVLEKSEPENKQQVQLINVSSLKQGLYLLKIIGNGISQTTKFIKK